MSDTTSNETVAEYASGRVQILRHRQRRELIVYLQKTDESTVSLIELTVALAESTDTHYAEILENIHFHLDKLMQCDLIEYDQRARDVSLALSAEALEAILAQVSNEPPSSSPT